MATKRPLRDDKRSIQEKGKNNIFSLFFAKSLLGYEIQTTPEYRIVLVSSYYTYIQMVMKGAFDNE